MAADDDTLDEPIEAAPRGPVVAIYRALATMRGRCDQLEKTITALDGSGAEQVAGDAVYRWLVAMASLRRLASLEYDQERYVAPARNAIDAASRMLAQRLRRAAHQIRIPQVRRTLAQLRLCLAIAADDRSIARAGDRRARGCDVQHESEPGEG
jgi:hypothetical protein